MNELLVSKLKGECFGPQQIGPKTDIAVSVEKPGIVKLDCSQLGDDNVCGISQLKGKCVYRALEYSNKTVDTAKHNRDLVVEYVQNNVSATQGDLVDALGLSQPSVSRITDELKVAGRIQSGDRVKPVRGPMKETFILINPSVK